MLKSFVRLICIVSLSCIWAINLAQTFTLTDTNTEARIIADDPSALDRWTLEGTDQVVTNTYLWRVGDTGTADFVQNLTLTNSNQFDDQFLTLTYTNASVGFEVNVIYALSGGTEIYDLAEIVRVRNIGNSTLNFRLFQYNDFNVRGDAIDDIAARLNSSTIEQGDSGLSVHYVVNGATPIPTFSQLGSPFLASLTGTAGYNLDTAAGDGIGQIASGDMAYAFQWNRVLAPGQNFTISTNKIASAPEPGTMAALGLGAIALLRRRKKR